MTVAGSVCPHQSCLSSLPSGQSLVGAESSPFCLQAGQTQRSSLQGQAETVLACPLPGPVQLPTSLPWECFLDESIAH